MTASPEAVALAIAAAEAASDKLAEDLVAIDVSEKLVITDVFVLCSAANERQVKAVVDGVEERLHGLGSKPLRSRGRGRGSLGPARLRRHRGPRPARGGAHPLRDRAALEGLPVHRAARGRPPGSARQRSRVTSRRIILLAARPHRLERRAPIPGPDRHPSRRHRAGRRRLERPRSWPGSIRPDPAPTSVGRGPPPTRSPASRAWSSPMTWTCARRTQGSGRG